MIFGFFVVGGQVYVGKTASADMQGQAQGFYALMAFGVGSFIGTFFNDALIKFYTKPEVLQGGTTVLKGNWGSIWLVTLACAIVCTVVMALLFNPKIDGKKA